MKSPLERVQPALPAHEPSERSSGAVALGPALAAPVVPATSARGPGPGVPRRFLVALDLVALAAAFALAYRLVPALQQLVLPGGLLRVESLDWLRLPSLAEQGDFPAFGEAVWLLAVMAPATVLFLQSLGAYRPLTDQSRTRLVVSCLGAPLLGTSVVALTLFALKQQRTSRLLVFTFVVFSMATLLACRSAIRAYKRRKQLAGHYAHNVVFIARPAAASWLAEHFARHVEPTAFRVMGYLPTWSPARTAIPGHDHEGSPDESRRAAPPVLGAVGDLGDLLIHRPIHEVVAVQAGADDVWLKDVMESCDYFRVTLRIVPEVLLAGELRDLQLMARSPICLPEIVLRPPHLDSDALFVKRLIDILVSGTLLVLLSPLLAVVALAIKLTTPRLPVLYPWRVIGYKGKPFTGYKFTTMVADADAQRDQLMAQNEMSGPVFKIKDDPRITPLGKILRKFSLNELPQLWSVFVGDMSLVGPRPAFPHELERYELWHKRKLSVQPGITCLWQVSGRNAISDFDEWVRLDLEYIDNWSLWLDLKILARTAWAVVAGTGS